VRDIYKYKTLKYKLKKDFTRQIYNIIYNKKYILYSGNINIIELNNTVNRSTNKENTYLVNIRWYGSGNSKDISLISRFKVDKNFNKISDEKFIEIDFEKEKNNRIIGIEDIRVFKHFDKYYYIAIISDETRDKLQSISSGLYEIEDDKFNLNKNLILPNFYDLDKYKIYEKNWALFNYNNDICIVYNWYPLQIGKIDYNSNKMNIIKIIYNTPEYFKDAKGTTIGYTYNNQIWFILHKSYFNHFENRYIREYNHFIAIFDLEMNLIRYSELFKFCDYNVEFCTGIIIKNDEMILSFGILDKKSIISTYDLYDINNDIKWY
jgi:hypothetical protein